MRKPIDDAIKEFAKEFYSKASQHLIASGAPDTSYILPEISTTDERSSEEEKVFHSLADRINEYVTDTNEKFRKGDITKEERALNLQSLEKHRDYQLCKSLKEKLGEDVAGRYLASQHRIDIHEELKSDNDIYSVLTHELLHSLRDQATIQKDTSNDRSVTEFFAEMNRIATRQLFPDKEIFSRSKVMLSSDSLEFKDLAEVGNYFTIGLEKRAKQFFKAYKSARKWGDKSLRKRSDKNKRIMHEKFDELQYHHDNFARANGYLYAICNVPQFSIGMLEEFIKSLKKPLEDWESTYSLKCTLDGLVKSASYKIPDRTAPYIVASLAVNRARTDLEKNWASVMLMDEEKVYEKYIAPVKDMLNKEYRVKL